MGRRTGSWEWTEAVRLAIMSARSEIQDLLIQLAVSHWFFFINFTLATTDTHSPHFFERNGRRVMIKSSEHFVQNLGFFENFLSTFRVFIIFLSSFRVFVIFLASFRVFIFFLTSFKVSLMIWAVLRVNKYV